LQLAVSSWLLAKVAVNVHSSSTHQFFILLFITEKLKNSEYKTQNTMSQNPYQANSFFRNITYEQIPVTQAPILMAWYIQNPENVGHLLRLAANVGCRLALFVEGNIRLKESKIKYVSGPAMNLIEWHFCKADDVMQQVPDDYTFVVLETAPGSSNIYNISLPLKMILMVGNENSGIPVDVHMPGQINVHIPMPGPVKSMNVSHAASVGLFEWVRQWRRSF
jgi:tRNA G18 (ribose-2'-O)-methylase SpoU